MYLARGVNWTAQLSHRKLNSFSPEIFIHINDTGQIWRATECISPGLERERKRKSGRYWTHPGWHFVWHDTHNKHLELECLCTEYQHGCGFQMLNTIASMQLLLHNSSIKSHTFWGTDISDTIWTNITRIGPKKSHSWIVLPCTGWMTASNKYTFMQTSRVICASAFILDISTSGALLVQSN